jgi:hypothetical protein
VTREEERRAGRRLDIGMLVFIVLVFVGGLVGAVWSWVR